MTTIEKLECLKEKSGRSWGNIAEMLGVSRQMMDFVRRDERRFSSECEKRLDELLQNLTTSRNAIAAHSRENILACLSDAHDKLRARPDGGQMVEWVATAMLEATEALRYFDEKNIREAYARAYTSQRIFGRIFRVGFGETEKERK